MNIGMIGAGIGGLTAGIALRKKGFDVSIHERASSFKSVGTGITIAANAMSILDDLGLAERVIAAGQPFESAGVGRPDGSAIARLNTERMASRIGFTNVGIHRADLHELLADEFGHDGIHCGRALTDLDTSGAGVVAKFENGESATCDVLVGADGLRSRVRELVFGDSPLRDAKQACWRGVLDRSALAHPDAVDPTVAWELWGRGARFGYLSINARQIYWYATLSEPLAVFPIEDVATFRARFTPMWNDTVQEILGATPDDAVVAAPLMDRLPAKDWHTDRVVLLGDAIHSTTPNMGQGACMAIESAWALAHCMAEDPNPHAAFAYYHEMRAARTRTITEQSFRMGGIVQTMSPLKAGVRNLVMGMIPAGMQERALVRMLAQTPLKLYGRTA